MAKKFDPYEKWFNIPPKEQPPNHYRLLGIERFESDASVIDEAAEARASFLHDVATGPQIAVTQRLLNEVAAARLCLADEKKRAAYDAALKEPPKAKKKAAPKPAPAAKPPKPRKAVPMAQPLPPPQDEPKDGFAVVTDDKPGAAAATRRSAPAGKNKQPVWIAAGAAVAGVLVLVIVVIAASSKGDSKAGTDDASKNETPVAVRDIRGGQTRDVNGENPVDNRQGNLTDVIKQHNASKNDLRRATQSSPIGTFDGKENSATWSFGSGLSDPRVTMKGLVVWLDAAEGSTVQGGRPLFKKWTDKSGNGNDAIPPRKARPPKHKDGLIHGHAAMQFDGGQLLLIKHNSKLNLNASYTIVFVAAGEGTLFAKGNAAGGQNGAIALQPNLSQLRFSKDNILAANGDKPNELKVRAAVANQQSVAWFVDGQPVGEYQGSHEVMNNAALQLGCAKISGKPRGGFNGKLAELLIYNRPLSDNERQSLEQYLNEKWLK
jgi:hypothetical protein